MFSRGLEISLDMNTMEAEVVWEFNPGDGWFGSHGGSVDRLDNGNTVVAATCDEENASTCNMRVWEVDENQELLGELVLPPAPASLTDL